MLTYPARLALGVSLILVLVVAPVTAAARSAPDNSAPPPDCVGYTCSVLAGGTTQLWGSFPFGVGTGNAVQLYAGDRTDANASVILIVTASADWTWVHSTDPRRRGRTWRLRALA